jgi:hypothetical protein
VACLSGAAVNAQRGSIRRGFDDEAGGGLGGEALMENGGADAAGCARLGEWPRFIPVGESRGKGGDLPQPSVYSRTNAIWCGLFGCD